MQPKEQAINFKNKFRECDDRFNIIFKLTSAASKIIDCDLTILKVNEALTELLGYSAKEIEGTKILDYACVEYKQYWHQLQEAMWKKGKPSFKLDACLYKKDQSLVWVHVTTILFKEDNVDYGFTVLDDYSYRKQYEESEKRLNMALKYSKMAAWELNTQDNSMVVSEGYDHIFGYRKSLKSWNKTGLLNHFLPEDGKRLDDLLNGIAGHPNIDFKGRIKTPDGVIKWVYLQGKAEDGFKGQPGRILGMIYDITKEKLAERHKDDFISIASHELKTPITALKASLQLMDQMKLSLNEKLPVLIAQANKSMAKVSVLIEDLLNASRMNEGQLYLKKTWFNLSRAIEESCQHVKTAGQFHMVMEGDPELKVFADSERIQRVLINFVNNAMKYAPDSKNIHIRIEKGQKDVKVSVTDQGPGIPKQMIPHLFERYYRADTNGSQYSGLGLYISSEIIKKHDGEIGVDSEVGKGSTFWFTLPIEVKEGM